MVKPGGTLTLEVVEPLAGKVPLEARVDGELGAGAEVLTTTEELGIRGVDVAREAVLVSMGQTVVEIGIVEVTTEIDSAGQLVTVGAQLVIVTLLVV